MDDVYLVRHKPSGKFVKFGSYKTGVLYDSPLFGTIYKTRGPASKRLNDMHVWVAGKCCPMSEFEVVMIEFSWE